MPYTWIDFPTETGWWWRKKNDEEPRLCNVVSKPQSTGDDVIMALFPEQGFKTYLDNVYPSIQWQRMKGFNK